jgi:hypothetical protein
MMRHSTTVPGLLALVVALGLAAPLAAAAANPSSVAAVPAVS